MNSDAARSSDDTVARNDPAASAEAVVVVITISRVLEVETAGDGTGKTCIEPEHRAHPGEHRRCHSVGDAADRSGQAGRPASRRNSPGPGRTDAHHALNGAESPGRSSGVGHCLLPTDLRVHRLEGRRRRRGLGHGRILANRR